jgi:hypothetical protein
MDTALLARDRPMPSSPAALVAIASLAAASSAPADVANLIPTADAFLSAAHASSNYGGGGSLSVAATGLARGEFQSLMQFDTAAAVSQFNTNLGVGRWTIRSVQLTLTSTPAGNPIFNPAAAGQFAITWMQNDAWEEGTGTPNAPGTTGVTYNDLASLTSAADELVGVFDYNGVVPEAVTRTLDLTAGFAADLAGGGAVSLRFSPVGATIAYLFNSRSFNNPVNWPTLSITADATCYANCDGSTTTPILTVNDFVCFQTLFAAGDPAANCDGSTQPPILNVNDFICFQQAFATGCP